VGREAVKIESDFEIFLESQKREGIKRLVGWVIILTVITVGIIGGMFWIFNFAGQTLIK
jgi:hypothetical protein